MDPTAPTFRGTRPACARREVCRICESSSLDLVLSFGRTPLANAFLRADQLADPEPTFPLDVFRCRDCGLLQLLDIVDPELLFRDYLYVSSTSASFVEHFRQYAEDLVRDYAIAPGSLVVEVGSNDGVLLRQFKALGMRVLGVDPAREIAAAATADGIETVARFFTGDLAREIRASRGPAAVVAANNVLAHMDDLHEVLDAARLLLAPDGVLVFEVSYLLDVVEKSLFDMTYHEHLCYHSVGPFRRALERHGMELIAARRVPTHGGSLRGIAQLRGAGRAVDPSVGELLAREQQAGLDKASTYLRFGEQILRMKLELRDLLKGIKGQGKSIAGFGAPAKLTTLMHHFEIGPELVDFVVDDSPLKQHRFTPGYHIPVLPVDEMYVRKPDFVLILAWNFAPDIIRRHERYRQLGGKFIVPLPKLEVR